jgi:predicted porin
MKKTLISTAIAAAMFTGASAHAATTGPELYGEIHLSGDYVSDNFDTTSMEDESEKSMVSRDTFIGVKGAQGLDTHGMDLVYDVQVGFDFDSASSSEDFELRKADVGVATDTFSVHAGRLENPYASLTQEGDLFKRSLASARTVFESGYVEHLDSTLATYITPVENLTLAVSYTQESDQEEDRFNVGGDTFDAYTLTAKYDLGMASVYGGYANFDFDNGLTNYDEDYIKLGTEIRPVENVQVNLSGERVDWGADDRTNVLAQVGYGVTPQVVLKAGLGYIGSTDVTESGNMYAVGADYKLGENTTIGATYADIDTDTGQNLYGNYTTAGDSNKGFSVALNHKF